MYCIQFYHRNGAVDWLRPLFSTKWSAHRFAKKHWRLIGANYIVQRV